MISRWFDFTVLTLFLGLTQLGLPGAELPASSVVLENFESYVNGAFPTKWRVRRDEGQTIYRVDSESSNRFLRARADKQGIQIAIEQIFEPKTLRRLSWRWRVIEFPNGADERDAKRHDAAAQVFVIFDNQYWPRIIKYIWSAELPVGMRFTNPLYGRGQVIVLRSGPAPKDLWQDQEINFFEDYKRLFAAEPGKVHGIGIMTSSDSTKSVAAADYDDLVLLP